MTVAAWLAVSQQRARKLRRGRKGRARRAHRACHCAQRMSACERRHNASVALFTRLRAGARNRELPVSRSGSPRLRKGSKSRPCLGGGRKRRGTPATHASGTGSPCTPPPHRSRPPAPDPPRSPRTGGTPQKRARWRNVPAQRPGSIVRSSTSTTVVYTITPWLAAACARVGTSAACGSPC